MRFLAQITLSISSFTTAAGPGLRLDDDDVPPHDEGKPTQYGKQVPYEKQVASDVILICQPSNGGGALGFRVTAKQAELSGYLFGLSNFPSSKKEQDRVSNEEQYGCEVIGRVVHYITTHSEIDPPAAQWVEKEKKPLRNAKLTANGVSQADADWIMEIDKEPSYHHSDLRELLWAANYYQIPGLVELCSMRIASIIFTLKRAKRIIDPKKEAEAIREEFGVAQPDSGNQVAVEEKSGEEGRRRGCLGRLCGWIEPHSMGDKKRD